MKSNENAHLHAWNSTTEKKYMEAGYRHIPFHLFQFVTFRLTEHRRRNGEAPNTLIVELALCRVLKKIFIKLAFSLFYSLNLSRFWNYSTAFIPN